MIDSCLDSPLGGLAPMATSKNTASDDILIKTGLLLLRMHVYGYSIWWVLLFSYPNTYTDLKGLSLEN